MAALPPTVEECCDWVSELCATLYDNQTSNDCDHNVGVVLDSLAILVNALDASPSIIARLQYRIKAVRSSFPLASKPTHKEIQNTIETIQEICAECRKLNSRTPSYVASDLSEFRLEPPRILPTHRPIVTTDCSTSAATVSTATISDASATEDLSSLWPDQLDTRASWFRLYFVGKPYTTLVSFEEDIIVSVVKERSARPDEYQFRILHRKKTGTDYHVVTEAAARQTEADMELKGHGYLLDHFTIDSKGRRKPLRSISAALVHNTQQQHHHALLDISTTTSQARTVRAALRTALPDIDVRCFREMSAQATILSGLEKGLLHFDEMEIPKCYKFGVLSVRDGQHSEEEWFSNSGLSESLERFLGIMGTPVVLEGYKGYTAGLDTKSGESGELSYVSSWRDCEIMFHIAPLMPCRDNDRQQVHRKRYIGNDIVCIVFAEGDAPEFNPDVIRSQFLHVYIVVRPEGKDAWRIQAVSKKNMVDYTPMLPSPTIIRGASDLRRFLLLKLINAENAALKSDCFTLPNTRARAGALKALTEMANQFSETRFRCDDDEKRSERPKSAGAHRSSRGSMRSLRVALGDNSHGAAGGNISGAVASEAPPPNPATSRSSMLKEWKNLTRRRSSGGSGSGHGCGSVSGGSTSGGNSSPSSSRGPSPLLVPHHPILLDDIRTTSPEGIHVVEQAKHKGQTRASAIATTSDEGATSIRSRAQHLMTSVMGRRSVPPIIRSKTFMMDHTGKMVHGGDRQES
ncbi:hypothetical protein BX666DRAFT_2025779 [Dichotomocladium elegans]|nr:hypothetical protein BX666DRAFT_2025779 [Dichotomocladium elegans]